MDQAEPVRRTSEIEEPTNLYLIHPIAARLVGLFGAWGVRPNSVSIAGMVFGILAGIAYNHYRHWYWAVAGFGLMVAWHVMDGADGQLARLTHAQSDLGKVLDGICDYVTFIAVYVGLGIAMARADGGAVLLVVALAGACHALQSASYEAQRQAYIFWAWGRAAAAPAALHPASLRRPGTVAARVSGFLLQGYEAVQALVGGGNTAFDARLATALSADAAAAATIRARYRACFAPAIRRWSALSSNYRTLGIFLCALLKMPLLYFAFEIVGFSLILLILAQRQRAAAAAFIATL